MPKVLAIDDDRTVLHMIKQAFRDEEIELLGATSAEEGLQLAEEHRPDVALLDMLLPETSGLEVVEQLHAIDSKLPVIFITGGGNSETAIEAMKRGAYDYLLKPLNLPQVRGRVMQALETRRFMHVPVRVPETEAPDHHEGDQLVGRSSQMVEVYKVVGRIAPQNVTVLIRGESGTGKELIARAIYQHSHRSEGPFLAVNCAALSESLLESELFGHEKGAFTGADSTRIGKFEQCNGGTIFLDEVGDMAPLTQSKVLRLLQQQQFERVGGNKTIQTDVRIIAATNRDLEEMVEKGEFRSDLYYRLNGFTIKLPPLRERPEDILRLLEHFLGRFSRELNKDVTGISPEALKVLTGYPWPGNVRELQSVLKQALLVAAGPVLVSDFLPGEVLHHGEHQNGSSDSGSEGLPASDLLRFIDQRIAGQSTNLYAEALEMMERFVVTRVLRESRGNQSQAARILGITRGSLRNKIRSLGISIDQVVNVEDAGDEDDEE